MPRDYRRVFKLTFRRFFSVSSVIPGAILPTNTLVVLTSLTKAGIPPPPPPPYEFDP